MQIGSINSFGATTKANNISFKGWTDTLRQEKEPDRKEYNSYSHCEVTIPGRVYNVTINKHWEDAAGSDERIKKYSSYDKKESSIEHMNNISSLLEQRAVSLVQRADDFKKASVECAQEAKNIKKEAMVATLREEIKEKERQIEAILNGGEI